MRATCIFIVSLIALIFFLPQPPSLAQNCRCECWRVPGGRVCQRICSPPPRPYVPPQSHNYYTPPRHHHVLPEFPAELALALGLLALIGVVAAIAAAAGQSSATDVLVQDTYHLRERTALVRADTQNAHASIASIEEEMQRQAASAYDRGRDRADQQWRERYGARHG